MFDFLLPSHVKKGKRLLHGVGKFAHAHSDLMNESQQSKLQEARHAYAAVLETRDKEKLIAEEKVLLESCQKAVPGYSNSSIKENVEVIIVAIIIALGIRAYFLQPFKIPTASMYPTLNGITAKRMLPEQFPNIVQRGLELAWSGANWTELRAPKSPSGAPVQLVKVRQVSYAMFFTKTEFIFNVDGQMKTEWSWSPARQLLDGAKAPGEIRGKSDDYLWMPDQEIPLLNKSISATDNFTADVVNRVSYASGSLLASGMVKTGDQVLVDKMSYHFRMPTRGEVFVFSTKNIRGIPMPEGIFSQHYIKRLAAVPHDKTLIAGGNIYTHGKLSPEFGMQRVMSRQNGYNGYTSPESVNQSRMPMPQEIAWSRAQSPDGVDGVEFTLGDRQYMALGDNSAYSSDSRVWGAVPEGNIIGPAFVVYWPFAPHFGLIK